MADLYNIQELGISPYLAINLSNLLANTIQTVIGIYAQ